MVIDWKDIIIMLSKEFLLIIFNIMFNQYSSCMVNYSSVIFVKQILTTIFWTISEYILQCYTDVGFVSGCFWVFIRWLFDCTYPGFYCHELITLIHCLSEILNLNWFWLFLKKFIRQVNIFIQVIKTIIFFLKLITFILNWRSSFNIPHNQRSIKTPNTYHLLISKFNFSYMRAVTIKSSKHLVGNVTWIFKHSDCLIIISDC